MGNKSSKKTGEKNKSQSAVKRMKSIKTVDVTEIIDVPQVDHLKGNLCKNFILVEPTIKRSAVEDQAIRENLDFLNELMDVQRYDKNLYDSLFEEIFELTKIKKKSKEYNTVASLFTNTNKEYFQIMSIYRNQNIYLLLQYDLKTLQLLEEYNGNVDKKVLFHGTRINNLDNICKNNFDWRLHGTNYGNKFGCGVSFTSISNYATHYGDDATEKAMILSRVLVSKSCIGTESTIVPDLPFDTTVNDKETVFVKYDDMTYYPLYIIYYQKIIN